MCFGRFNRVMGVVSEGLEGKVTRILYNLRDDVGLRVSKLSHALRGSPHRKGLLCELGFGL